MFKTTSVIALAFASSLTLWGCSDAAAEKDLIDVMKTAVIAYESAKDKTQCDKAGKDFKTAVEEKHPSKKILQNSMPNLNISSKIVN